MSGSKDFTRYSTSICDMSKIHITTNKSILSDILMLRILGHVCPFYQLQIPSLPKPLPADDRCIIPLLLTNCALLVIFNTNVSKPIRAYTAAYIDTFHWIIFAACRSTY